MANGATNDSLEIWALLVGIDHYAAPDLNSLRGCGNDVNAFRDFLRDQMSVPNKRIRTLIGPEATRDSILAEFQSFLVENADIPHGAQIVFQFSGHGSQMRSRDPGEADAFDETIVAQDSRLDGVFDIPDKTLAALIERLARKKGENLMVILDCCHSGSGTRAPGATDRIVRRIEADLRLPPEDLDADIRQGNPARHTGPSGWATEGSLRHHVLLAGCRDREEAHEHLSAQGDHHGAMTCFLLEDLRWLSPETTYNDLHAQVAARVNARYPNQMPQCEGQRSRVVFGGQFIRRAPRIRVLTVDDGRVTVDAGNLVPGLGPGALLTGEGSAAFRVTSITFDRAEAEITRGRDAVRTGMTVTIEMPVYGGRRRRVRLESDGATGSNEAIDMLRKALETAAGDTETSLELCDTANTDIDYRVIAREGRFSVFGADDTALVLPVDYKIGTAERAVHVIRKALEAISRYQKIESISNNDYTSQVQGRVKLRLLELGPDGKAKPLRPASVGEGGEIALTFRETASRDNLFVVEVINESTFDVYPHVFILNPDFSIQRLYPNHGQENAVTARKNGEPGRIQIGIGASGEKPLEIFLPPNWNSSRDQLLLVATTSPQPGGLAVLPQQSLQVPAPTRGTGPEDEFRGFLASIAAGRQTRHSRPHGASGGIADWGTAALPYNVAREPANFEVNGAAAARHELGGGMTLETPAGFDAEITISLAAGAHARRSVSASNEFRLPPGLAHLTEEFQLLGAPGTRCASEGGMMVELALPESSRQAVSEESPLRFHMPDDFVEDSALVFPVIFDGEDVLVTGVSVDRPGDVEVRFLPKPAATTRGATRKIKLFFCKKLGRLEKSQGLRQLVKAGKGWEPVKAVPAHFAAGQRVALSVHGFNADADWHRRDLIPWLDGLGDYDHFLTFNYESYGTSVEATGLELARALRHECGLNGDGKLEVDLFAHSMGSLVTRAMIELHGGSEFVNRLVMAGPPNGGTPLANATRGLAYLASAFVGGFSLPAAGALAWVLEEMRKRGAGLADLKVDSEVAGKLNDVKKPAHLRYLVVAGDADADDCSRNFFARLAGKVLDKSLDAFFGEKEHDAVVSATSMKRVHGLPDGCLEIHPAACNHFDYYADDAVRDGIERWLELGRLNRG